MERRGIAIRGTVQGVGFRPFVFGLASRLRLNGFVRNQTAGVCIEVEGEPASLDEFLALLKTQLPPLATIDDMLCEPRAPRGDRGFSIEHSDREASGGVVICPDVATCAQCLAELFDPRDRRYRYPFLNCTNCGPRLTIVTGAPYDRERTTMAGFAMCSACRAEYGDPSDRRFHAQPIACPRCGPRLELLDGLGKRLEAGDPLLRCADALRAGRIVALKGLGGYHLACDARRPAVVAELRGRKHRDEKPFAIMVRDIAAAEHLCTISPAEKDLLLCSRRPIVLLRKRAGAAIAEEVAPHNPLLGIMLPYTPLHHLLLDAMDGIPLVMTSGNRSDEPIAFEDADAIERLRGIADLFLIHNRPIHVRCDDSVTRVLDGVESPMRRSRGYAPQPLRLPLTCPGPILAVGGQQKVAFALGRDRQATLSHHMGDLDHFEAYRAFERDITLYERLFAIRPQWIAHDLHPDYSSTRYALRRGDREGIACMAVQHHHAHMAACMAEHGLTGPVIGVTFDGTGFGTDGHIWGGEFLIGDYQQFRRAAHLRYVGMPGGERAIREPWRMALAHLVDAGCPVDGLEKRLPATAMRTVQQTLEKRFNTPLTSSAGRLFDAVAALAGLRDCCSYEGQAAIELEWAATDLPPAEAYPFDIAEVQEDHRPQDRLLHVDTRPMIRAVVADVNQGAHAGQVGRRFHSTMAEVIATVCRRLATVTGLDRVVLSGGVFMNALLSAEVGQRLECDGFRVYRHRLVPPNDGGLSLGQLAIAAASLGHP